MKRYGCMERAMVNHICVNWISFVNILQLIVQGWEMVVCGNFRWEIGKNQLFSLSGRNTHIRRIPTKKCAFINGLMSLRWSLHEPMNLKQNFRIYKASSAFSAVFGWFWTSIGEQEPNSSKLHPWLTSQHIDWFFPCFWAHSKQKVLFSNQSSNKDVFLLMIALDLLAYYWKPLNNLLNVLFIK